MRFWKIVLFVFSLLIINYSFIIPAVKAADEFTTDSAVTYDVQPTGITKVTHKISLENNFSTLYATSYTLTLENIEAQNVKAYSFSGINYSVEQKKEGEKTTIKVIFSDNVVGRGEKREFYISYDNPNFAVKTGEVWEISIPKLYDENSFRNYDIELRIPHIFGQEAYISPNPNILSDQENFKSYKFEKSDILKSGISAGFGEFQVFTFTLNYHLENPLSRSAKTEIAIPPDSAFQKVYIRSIVPQPENIYIDSDGNWMAQYKLSARQRVDVVVSGDVQIFSSYRHFPAASSEALSSNILSTNYWQADNEKIKRLAEEYNTPRKIYDYVTSFLKYDYERVRPNVTRLGAVSALDSSQSAICMEFTDLFVAIARAAGIPAREVNGYAYTENPQIQPLSLVADVLHSWPEYYDKEKNVWIPVDPTWGSTSGIDYFDKLDLRHFAFVYHGKNSEKPYPPGSYKLGVNPQKDVFVSFGKLSPDRISFPEIKAEYHSGLFFLNSRAGVQIYNPGPAAIYDLTPVIYFDEKVNSSVLIPVMPPFSYYNFDIKVPFSLLGQKTPTKIKIEVDNGSFTLLTNKNKIIMTGVIILFTFLFFLLIAILLQQKQINFKNIWSKITKIFR